VSDYAHPPVRTILFDLDGTLVDTAPDMAYALNRIREEEGHPHLPYELIREQVSNGSAALIRLAFGDNQDATRHTELKDRFLEIYRSNLNLDSCLFPGMAAVLAFIEQRGMNWGVVTNKPAWLTDPLMEALGLAERSISTISGDSTDQRKPHPKPLLIACEAAGSTPAECIYVGDALRDIEAGRAAMMRTLVALYGYIDAAQHPADWGADGLIEDPRELLHWLNLDAAHRHPLAR
jgi:2-phosphoglycolate phosphatase